MRAIDTTATVTSDGTLTAQVPPEIPPGQHRVVLVIEERAATRPGHSLADFPVLHVGAWPGDLSLRREDMYGDCGR
jgi:hypothetical protein